LLDFGLAKRAAPLAQDGATLTQALTQHGQIVGTLQYMAPEQLQGKEADARGDIFAFGCVLYEMLTGKRAFEGQSTASVIAAILEREPASLTAAPPLERVVRRALAKDSGSAVSERPRSEGGNAVGDGAAGGPNGRQAQSALALDRRSYAFDRQLQRLDRGVLSPSTRRQQPLSFRYRSTGTRPLHVWRPLGGLALSPNGRNAAFVASANGKDGLWVRPVDGAAVRRIAGTEGAANPFWSPDSQSIAFFVSNKLLRVDLAGGVPVAICDADNITR
jgi:eukaryotic-like serine/threonine-protein kinase